MRATEPVLIIGAGPTGLSAALALGLEGIPAIVFEADSQLPHDLRAGSFHPPTIEMLTKLGVGDAMHATGIVVPRWQVRDRLAGVVAEFDLSLLRDETPYPYRLHLEQHRLTPLLLAEIAAHAPSVDVRFASPVAAVAQDAAGVSVTLASGETVRGSYAVGCDGARSVVRAAMGVEFEGFTWPERYLVASTTFDLGALGFSGAGYIADPDAWAAVFHVPDIGPPGLWRIAYPIPPEADQDAELQDAPIQRQLATLLVSVGGAPAGGFPIKYASVYKVHQRVAQRFVAGRLVLAGDAAHVNNPLGGLGLNGSVHDAVNLAAKLVSIVKGDAEADDALDLYDRQRRPINVRAVQAMSIRNKRLLEEKDPAIRRAHLDEQRALANDPVKAKAHLMNTSMINSVREAASIA